MFATARQPTYPLIQQTLIEHYVQHCANYWARVSLLSLRLSSKAQSGSQPMLSDVCQHQHGASIKGKGGSGSRAREDSEESDLRWKSTDENYECYNYTSVTSHLQHGRQQKSKISSRMYLIMLFRVMSTEENLSNHIHLIEITREVGIKSKINWIILTDDSENLCVESSYKGTLVTFTRIDHFLSPQW